MAEPGCVITGQRMIAARFANSLPSDGLERKLDHCRSRVELARDRHHSCCMSLSREMIGSLLKQVNILQKNVDNWQRRRGVCAMDFQITAGQSAFRYLLAQNRCRLVCMVTALMGGVAGTTTVEAGDWMFRRSYYSHHIPAEVEAHYPRPISRSAYRRAVVPPGFSIRGEYRRNTMILQNRNSTDYRSQRHNWFQFSTP